LSVSQLRFVRVAASVALPCWAAVQVQLTSLKLAPVPLGCTESILALVFSQHAGKKFATSFLALGFF